MLALHTMHRCRGRGQRGVKPLEQLLSLESTRELKLDVQVHLTGSTQHQVERAVLGCHCEQHPAILCTDSVQHV